MKLTTRDSCLSKKMERKNLKLKNDSKPFRKFFAFHFATIIDPCECEFAFFSVQRLIPNGLSFTEACLFSCGSMETNLIDIEQGERKAGCNKIKAFVSLC